MNAIRARIASRALAADDRLPSIRSFAATMGVSPSTVVEAYDRLAAEGLIRARPGSGFYVSSAALPRLSLAQDQPQRDRAVDPFWVSRQSLDAASGALKPGCGWLPADWMPTEALRRAFRGLARAEDAVLADYGATRGSLALRRTLMARFADEGLDASPDQVLLTMSGTQAIDLICRFLLRPGDTVLVDDPCYFNFRALLRAHQVKLVSVPYTPSGPDVASFEAVLEAERPRLYITVSGLHNPTGATMSPQTAHRVLNAATACDLTIVEDDIFADFEPEPSARLAALDGLNRVIRIGSFSKTLSASLRCGFIAARADWIEQLVDLQVATGFGGPCAVATEIIASVLATGFYRKHVEELRRRLARARRDVGEKLQRIGIEPWLMPRGGFQLWCRLPDGCDSADVARAALADNIVLAPGNVFSTTQSASGFMRFNVAQCRDPKLMPALQRALGR
ncbi:PLP-dependent aminotransferase family protein [Bradyrhizobium viridifuturi]|nr:MULTISPECIES: PLP-dependent aminotransferase family protein [Bradyrhizobium]PSO15811.1 GntR family transcriptional regulator [Bradyrhizobium sp. MOS004]QRI73418.1 PLP-dependent aminotransferase family protein [Bradyrhizobium sp. PSBB068]MBR1019157.1 PLP-dependent aminotransferase family protein [Bradyrhizobium viridifuturi]MBR1034691.1 PLP-dependent aminotransferase family protein [Bradyrhizobium viridifuturi]MBR1042924.1 PLP-dependent aminotransferase family protein [Bradyrhizobium viridif